MKFESTLVQKPLQVAEKTPLQEDTVTQEEEASEEETENLASLYAM